MGDNANEGASGVEKADNDDASQPSVDEDAVEVPEFGLLHPAVQQGVHLQGLVNNHNDNGLLAGVAEDQFGEAGDDDMEGSEPEDGDGYSDYGSESSSDISSDVEDGDATQLLELVDEQMHAAAEGLRLKGSLVEPSLRFYAQPSSTVYAADVLAGCGEETVVIVYEEELTCLRLAPPATSVPSRSSVAGAVPPIAESANRLARLLAATPPQVPTATADRAPSEDVAMPADPAPPADSVATWAANVMAAAAEAAAAPAANAAKIFLATYVAAAMVGRMAEDDAAVRCTQAQGTVLAHRALHWEPYAPAMSPDGRVLATGGDGGFLYFSALDFAAAKRSDKMRPLAHISMQSGPIIEHMGSMGSMGSMAVNCIRFGMVGGRMRVLAACTNAHIYIFEIPDVSPDSPQGYVSQLMCTGLGATAEPNPPTREPFGGPRPYQAAVRAATCVHGSRAHQHTEYGSSQEHTCAIGPFEEPLNCAVASPDGNWIAAVGDMPHAYLLSRADGYSSVKILHFWPTSTDPMAAAWASAITHMRDTGAQYCCWNATSTLLAVSSDYVKSVFVWDVASRAQVLVLRDHRRPCMALSFAPWDPQLLVYAEEYNTIHLAEIGPCGLRVRQRIHVPPLCTPGTRPLGERTTPACINGLVLMPSGRLLVATENGMYEWQLLKAWTPQGHRHFPDKLRDTVKALLMAAATDSSGCPVHAGPGRQAVGLWSLPKDLLHNIIARAAFPLSSWLCTPPGSQPV